MSNPWHEYVNQKIAEAGHLVRTYPNDENGEVYRFETRLVRPIAWGTIPIQLDYRLHAHLQISKESKVLEELPVDYGSVFIATFVGMFTEQGLTNSRKGAYICRYFNDTLHDISEILETSWKHPEK